MVGRGYSWWDEMGTPQECIDDPVIVPGPEAAAHRAVARVRLCEEALRMRNVGPPEALARMCRSLTVEQQRRLAYWGSRSLRRARAIAAWTCIVAASCFGSVLASAAVDPDVARAISCLGVFVVLLMIGGWLAARFLGPKAKLFVRRCPNCEYDLSSLPPELHPEKLDGLFIGPRVCPECGDWWPLVPPEPPRDWRQPSS